MALKYVISLVYVAVFLLFGKELGFTATSSLWTHLTFSFQHASITHLVINTLVFITAFRSMERFVRPVMLFTVIYLISVIASFAAIRDIPTVGSSGMIYAIFGMETIVVIFNSATNEQKALFFFAIVFMLGMSFFNSGSSFMVHAVSFILGALFFLIKRKGYFRKHPSRKHGKCYD